MIDSEKDIILKRDFFSRDTALVARELLGKTLVRISKGEHTSGIIIETEAYYGPDDPASHASRGMTPRSSIMFGEAAVAYVYLCYGVYWLLNVVTEKKDNPGAVLIRGIKPLRGIEAMKIRRKNKEMKGLADGPGKLTVAMDINGKDNGRDMTSWESGLFIAEEPGGKDMFKIKNTSRIGITEGKDMLLRYVGVGL